MIDSSFYSLLYESSNPVRRYLHMSRRNWISERIQRFLSSLGYKTKVLEVGFGDGSYLKMLLGHSSEVWGFDFSSNLIENGQNVFGKNIKFIEGDVRTFKMDEKFEFILCTEVIEHIEESDIAIKNMTSWLKGGGILVLTTPNSYSILEVCCRALRFPILQKIATVVYREKVQDLGHIGLVTERKLRKLFELHGLEIIEQSNFGLYIPIVAEVFRTEYTVKVLSVLERLIAQTPLRKLLWTQAYVLRKE